MPSNLLTLLIVAGFGLIVLLGIWSFAREALRKMRADDDGTAMRRSPQPRRQAAVDMSRAPGVEVTIASLPRSQQLLAIAGMFVLMVVGIGIMYTDPSTRIECTRTETGASIECTADARMYWLIPLRTQTLQNVVAVSNSFRSESNPRGGGQTGRDTDSYVAITLTGGQGDTLVVETEAEFAPWLRPDVARIQALIDDPAQRTATLWAIPQLTSVLGILLPGLPLLVFTLWLLFLAGAGKGWLRSGSPPQTPPVTPMAAPPSPATARRRHRKRRS